MAATVYQDTQYGGAFLRIRAGQFLNGRFLAGQASPRTLYTDIPLDNEISSIRVEVGSLAVIYGGQSRSASGGARVIIGPRDIPDLSALGMDNQISAVQVLSYDPYRTNLDGPPVTLHAGYARGGQFRDIRSGDFDAARLSASEVKFPSDSLRSVQVPSNTVVVLYDGAAFDEAKDAIAIAGPAVVDDLDRYGVVDRVSSIRVLRTQPTSRDPNSRAPSDPYPGLPPGMSQELRRRELRRSHPGTPRVVSSGQEPSPPQVVAQVGGHEAAKKPRMPIWAIFIIVLMCLLLIVGVGIARNLNHRSQVQPTTARITT